VEPTQQQPDDAELDAMLSLARWPEPTRESTRRLERAWASVSPARRRVWKFPIAVAAAAAVVLLAFGVAVMTKTRSPESVAVRPRVIALPTTTKSHRPPVLYVEGSRAPTARERLAMMSATPRRRSHAEPASPSPAPPPAPSVAVLLSDLDSPRSEVRYAAARELGRLNGPTTTAALVGRINAGKRPREAVAALLSSKSDDAVNVVRQLRASRQWSAIVQSAENQIKLQIN
jgi:hypothetical protein